jgi:hypothetical protein
VSLPVVGSVCVDLELYVGLGTSIVLVRRDVRALVLQYKSLDFPNFVFLGTVEMFTLGIHPLYELWKTLQCSGGEPTENEEFEDSDNQLFENSGAVNSLSCLNLF